MHGGLGVDAVTDRDNSVEVVVVGIVNLPVGGSYPEFPDNCRLTQLLSFKDILEVLVHGTDIYPKSSRNLRLRCLYRLVLQITTQLNSSAWRLVYHQILWSFFLGHYSTLYRPRPIFSTTLLPPPPREAATTGRAGFLLIHLPAHLIFYTLPSK